MALATCCQKVFLISEINYAFGVSLCVVILIPFSFIYFKKRKKMCSQGITQTLQSIAYLKGDKVKLKLSA